MAEICKFCNGEVTAEEATVPVQFSIHDFVVRMFRYVCPVDGTIWANEEQRAINEERFYKAFKRVRGHQNHG